MPILKTQTLKAHYPSHPIAARVLANLGHVVMDLAMAITVPYLPAWNA